MSQVSALGLGCMSICASYARPMTEEEGIGVIHGAYDNGVTFFDTADVYGANKNEIIVGKVIVAVALNVTRAPLLPGYGTDNPVYRQFCKTVCLSIAKQARVFFHPSKSNGMHAFASSSYKCSVCVVPGQALKSLPRENIQLATKFGLSFQNGEMVVQGSREYVRKCCEASLERLDVDYIDLYYQHRVDTNVPVEETVSCLQCSPSSKGWCDVVLTVCVFSSWACTLAAMHLMSTSSWPLISTGWRDEEAGGRRQGQVPGSVGVECQEHTKSACCAPHHCRPDRVLFVVQGGGGGHHPNMQVRWPPSSSRSELTFTNKFLR